MLEVFKNSQYIFCTQTEDNPSLFSFENREIT
jgi:hypothetical protein